MMGWMVSLVMFISLSLQWQQQTRVPDHHSLRQSSSVCNVTVDAGPDVIICEPGGEVQLMGSVSGTPVFTEWTPSTGLSNPSILNPVATVTSTTTYTLTALAIDPS